MCTTAFLFLKVLILNVLVIVHPSKNKVLDLLVLKQLRSLDIPACKFSLNLKANSLNVT